MRNSLNLPCALERVGVHDAALIRFESLREAGLESHAVAALVRSGELVRIRRGLYALGDAWRGMQTEERYRLFVSATATLSKPGVVLSHASAAVMHGLPTIGAWPRTVHTIEPDATGGSTARFTTSHRSVPAPSTVHRDGHTITSLARTLVDVAATSSFLVGVTMTDHALRVEQERVWQERERGIRGAPALMKDDLYEELAAVKPRSGARRVEQVITFASELAANPGESLSRVRIVELGFEVPELQVHFPVGGKSYWVDFFWRRIRKIGEFDGRHKYTRGVILGDRDPAEVVWAEKCREDILRPHSNSFCRWFWDIAISPRLFYEFLIEHEVPRA